jgi:hypothetical protein
VCEAVGEDFTEDEVVEAIRACNYEAKKSISYLLYGSYSSTPTKKTATSAKTNQTTLTPTPYKGPTTTAKQESPTPLTKGGNKVTPSALAVDLCMPVEASTPQLKDIDPSGAASGTSHWTTAFSLQP